jgi:N-acetylglucosaminyl-diphospho-decaprenol L-rhamnosyltransferase
MAAAAIASLRTQTRPPDEVIVVDNAASEGTPLDGAVDLGGVRIAEPATNVGFGAGCNVGASTAAGDELLMMNADVLLHHDALGRLIAHFDRDPTVAVVGPRILSGGSVQPSARAFPSFRTGMLGRRSIATRVLLRAGRLPTELDPTRGKGGIVDWVSGACMLIRAEAFHQVGGFDEGYWMYWEDADLCRRLANAGWKVTYEPAALVRHATGASGTSERTIRAFHDSAARFAEQHIAGSNFQRRLIRSALRARTTVVLRSWARRRHRARTR